MLNSTGQTDAYTMTVSFISRPLPTSIATSGAAVHHHPGAELDLGVGEERLVDVDRVHAALLHGGRHLREHHLAVLDPGRSTPFAPAIAFSVMAWMLLSTCTVTVCPARSLMDVIGEPGRTRTAIRWPP